MKETEDHDDEELSYYMCHKKAFKFINSCIQKELIEREQTLVLGDLLSMYKNEYVIAGGNKEDVEAYPAQTLMRKVKDHFQDKLAVGLYDYRKGNILYSSAISEDEAKGRLNENSVTYEEENKLRWAALHLRSQILKLPKTKTPNPATVTNLRESAPDIPAQLDLFFRTLIGGTTSSANTNDRSNEGLE